MVRFKRILVPIPMEQYPEKAIRRARELIYKYNSKIYLVYVIEDNVFTEITDISNHILTEKDKFEWHQKMINSHRNMAKGTILKNVEKCLGQKVKNFDIIKGMYSDKLIDEVNKYKCDLILIEIMPGSFIRYRIIETSPIPVWIVRHENPLHKICLLCTNKNPNVMAPELALSIAKEFNAELFCYFILDNSIPPDYDFVNELSQKYDIKWEGVKTGRIENEILKIINQHDFDLVVLGRIKIHKLIKLRRKASKKVKCSILFSH